MFNQVDNPKRDTSLVIGMLISIGIVCIAALLVIGSITQNNDSGTIFPIKRSADKNKLSDISTQLSLQSELKTFNSYEDLSNYLESSASGQNYYAGNLRTFAMDSMAEAMPMAINESVDAGFGGGGLHGIRALEGTFLGGCVFSARMAAATIIHGTSQPGLR